MSRSLTLEGQPKEAARTPGALQSALSNFEGDVQTYAITSAEEIPVWIAKMPAVHPGIGRNFRKSKSHSCATFRCWHAIHAIPIGFPMLRRTTLPTPADTGGASI